VPYSYTIIGQPPADQPPDSEIFVGETTLDDKVTFMTNFRARMEHLRPGWSWTFHFKPVEEAPVAPQQPQEIQPLQMYCIYCQKMTNIRAVYDSVEVWTVMLGKRRDGTRSIDLLEQIEPSDIVGPRDFTCAECHEPVMKDGEYVESEERLLEIIDKQFMD
jgi:hypothetical protein